MKYFFARAIFVALFFSSISGNLFAQAEINTEFTNRMNYVFGRLNKNQIPTGFLEEYGCPMLSQATFNGTLTDSNHSDMFFLRYCKK